MRVVGRRIAVGAIGAAVAYGLEYWLVRRKIDACGVFGLIRSE